MECPRCKSENIKKFGKVKTRKRSKRIQRFKCKDCQRTFTKRNFLPEYREKKSQLNKKIIEEFYPNTDYVNMKGRQADPYLSHLNFTCALVRNRLSRMNRKPWSFNRSNERLQLNLELLKFSFNQKFKAA